MTNHGQGQATAMPLRYAGACRECGKGLPAGTTALYDRETKTVSCVACTPQEFDDSAIDAGTAGASALREFERRKANRETRIRKAHPHVGGLLLAVSDVPQSTAAWQKGARGELILGQRLDKAKKRGIHVLHDRRIPGTKANIDHIVVGPRGVFVIDAKRYKGRPHLQVDGGFLRPSTKTLKVGSRDCMGLVSGVHKQMSLVQNSLDGAGVPGIPVFGMLCFVEAEWPLVGGEFAIDGVEVLWPAKAVSRISEPGPLDVDRMLATFRALAVHFPSA